MNCPLCGYEFDETALTCQAHCPMAAVQGCSLLCCPNCGYQMVDERKSGLAQLLRRVWKIIHPEGKTRMIVPLHHLKPGQSAQVVELKSDDPARLDRLSSFGLVPGSTVRLEQIYPALIIRVDETEISVDTEVASEILVRAA